MLLLLAPARWHADFARKKTILNTKTPSHSKWQQIHVYVGLMKYKKNGNFDLFDLWASLNWHEWVESRKSWKQISNWWGRKSCLQCRGIKLSEVQGLNLRFQDTSGALSTNTLPKAQCSQDFITFAKATARQARKKWTLGFNQISNFGHLLLYCREDVNCHQPGVGASLVTNIGNSNKSISLMMASLSTRVISISSQ